MVTLITDESTQKNDRTKKSKILHTCISATAIPVRKLSKTIPMSRLETRKKLYATMTCNEPRSKSTNSSSYSIPVLTNVTSFQVLITCKEWSLQFHLNFPKIWNKSFHSPRYPKVFGTRRQIQEKLDWRKWKRVQSQRTPCTTFQHKWWRRGGEARPWMK